MHQRGPALVRIALFSLLFGAFALALVQPVQAGTEAVPEIQDPANDHVLADDVPACAPAPASTCSTGGGVDIRSAWIDNETASQFILNLRVGAATHASGTCPACIGSDTYAFAFTIGTTAYTASAAVSNTATTPGGVATAATMVDTLLKVVVLKSAVGNPVSGAQLTGFSVSADRTQAPIPVPLVSDDATGTIAYIFTGGSGTPVTPGDSDNDGLNDTCETQFFGGLNGTNNATADPDGDGLTNGQECASNPRTDPTKADTDGDGTPDNTDPFPTDPTKGGTSGSSSSSTSGTSSSASSSSSNTGTGSTTMSTTGDGAGEVKTFADAVEKLKSDLDYLGISGGGLLVVLVLAILALSVRWSL